MNKVINQEIEVNALYFTGKDMKTFPRSIQYDGRSVTFANGLRYLIHRGSTAIKVFDMIASDGLTYRLRQDDSTWTLLGLRGDREVTYA